MSTPSLDPACSDLGPRLTEAARARRAVIVTGANVNDRFHHDGRFVYLLDLISLACEGEGRAVVVCSALGTRQHPAPGQPPAALHLPEHDADASPGQVVRVLCDHLRAVERPVAVVLDFADLALPNPGAGGVPSPEQQLLIETLASFPTDPALGQHRLIVIARSDGLDPRLARFTGWAVVRADLPDERHRAFMARRIIERHTEDPSSVGGLEPGLTPERLARLSGGLTLDELMRGAVEAGETDRTLTQHWVQATKVARLRQRNVEGLDVYAPGTGLAAVAGLPQVRLFIQERMAADIWPRSIVLAGPPGVGKTLVVRAIADELGWPAVALGNVRSMWQGETERNMRGVLSAVRAMAPLVVHIDEVDQVLGQRDTGPSTDGGTGARILAELWSFLSDSSPDIPMLFVLTTNRSDILDPATKSRSEIIPILHPTPSEQVELLRLACARVGWPTTPEVAKEVLEAADLGLVSGRMLVRIAQRAVIEARVAGVPALRRDHLLSAAEELLERADDVDDERMALNALALATTQTYLPWVAAERLGQPAEILPYVAPLLDPRRHLDRKRLAERIVYLDAQARRRQVSRMA